jgi:hypothetical protein
LARATPFILDAQHLETNIMVGALRQFLATLLEPRE